MNPISRYLLRSLFSAAIYCAIGLVFWPSQQSPPAVIVGALIWGLLIQAFVMRRERLGAQGKEFYHPVFYFVTGFLGLGFCLWCWSSLTLHPAGSGWIGLLGGGALSLLLLGCGFTAVWRSRESVAVPAAGERLGLK